MSGNPSQANIVRQVQELATAHAPTTALGARAVPDAWQGVSSEYPRHSAVHTLVEELAAQTPQAPALLFADRVVTYGELNAAANQIAHHLISLGIGRGSVVGLCLLRSPQLIAGMLGILKAGGAYAPLDPEYPAERLRFMLADTQASVVLAHAATRDKLAACGTAGKIVCADADAAAIAGHATNNPLTAVAAQDLAYVMYTSGSTGTPKGVMVDHRAIVRLVRNTNYCDFSADQVFLQLAPISFDASTFEIWGALLNGTRLAIMPPQPPGLEDIGAAIRRYGVTTMWLTSGMFNLMVDQRPELLRPVRQLLAGGDVLSPAHVARALAAMDEGVLINGYGPTETTTFACCHRITKDAVPRDTVPIGRPLANTRVYVLDDTSASLPVGEIGELCIGGDGVARGYLNSPELTAQKFVADPIAAEPGARLYRTGDRARFREDGTLEFLGRTDNQVKVAGHRVELGEIEVALRMHAVVRDAALVVAGSTASDKRLVAYVVPTAGAPTDPGAWREFLSAHLPQFMIPSSFVSLDVLPLSPNGKVDRAALLALEPSAPVDSGSPTAPATELERLITLIWKGVLSCEVGTEDNFFDLGGDSLQLIMVHAELQKVLPFELSMMDLFEFTTVRALADHLGSGAAHGQDFAAVQSRAQKQQAALAQQRRSRAVQ